jgi:hypothetical protein
VRMLATGAARYECSIKQKGSFIPAKAAAVLASPDDLYNAASSSFFVVKRFLAKNLDNNCFFLIAIYNIWSIIHIAS